MTPLHHYVSPRLARLALTPAERRRLLASGAMQRIPEAERSLSPLARAKHEYLALRDPQPGDYGRIAGQHGVKIDVLRSAVHQVRVVLAQADRRHDERLRQAAAYFLTLPDQSARARLAYARAHGLGPIVLLRECARQRFARQSKPAGPQLRIA